MRIIYTHARKSSFTNVRIATQLIKTDTTYEIFPFVDYLFPLWRVTPHCHWWIATTFRLPPVGPRDPTEALCYSEQTLILSVTGRHSGIVHDRTRSHTIAHDRTRSHTIAHGRTRSHTVAHDRTRSYTISRCPIIQHITECPIIQHTHALNTMTDYKLPKNDRLMGIDTP